MFHPDVSGYDKGVLQDLVFLFDDDTTPHGFCIPSIPGLTEPLLLTFAQFTGSYQRWGPSWKRCFCQQQRFEMLEIPKDERMART